jgi:hypothetical protein
MAWVQSVGITKNQRLEIRPGAAFARREADFFFPPHSGHQMTELIRMFAGAKFMRAWIQGLRAAPFMRTAAMMNLFSR